MSGKGDTTTKTTLDRLEDLARRNLAAQQTYEAHMRGVPLPECLINLAEALAANIDALHRNVARQPPPPMVIVTSDEERDRIKAMFER